jgi:HPt (histidine-containing phosphotransfer) domain-containing protein
MARRRAADPAKPLSKNFVESLVAKLLPRSLEQADENTRRRARLVIQFSFAIFLCGPGYGAVYLLLGMPVSALGAGVAAVVLFATPFVQRRTGSVTLGAHLVAFGCYAALALVTAPTGGLAAPAVAWLALVPVTALMLGGGRAGKIWTVVSLATVVVYFVLDASGRTPVSEVPGEWLRVLRLTVNLGLVALIALLAWLYESNKDRMLARVETANAALARARDEAEAAHRGARLVLDHVAQGLLIVDRAGNVVGERSRFATTLLGPSRDALPLWDSFGATDPRFAGMLKLGWEAVFEDILPLEVTLEQLPTTCRLGEKTLSFAYVPVLEGSLLERILVVVSDETSEVEARQIGRKRQEQLDVFRWIMNDGAYFASAYKELATLVRTIVAETVPWRDRLRLLHTLKGNASVFGLTSLVGSCHELEDQIRDRLQTALTEEQLRTLGEAWTSATALIEPLLGGWRADQVSLARRDYDELLADAAKRDAGLHARMLAFSWEPTRAQLERLGKQARSLAARLGKGELRIVVEDDGTRAPPDQAPFWASAVHLVRNAVDHGIEAPPERHAAGKPEVGCLTLRARTQGRSFVFEIEDDGGGIDWARVRASAVEWGLPAESDDDLERALFADGLSTREEANDLSGRGVGMAAVLGNCQSLGAQIEVHSTRGTGTRVRVTIPLAARGIAA